MMCIASLCWRMSPMPVMGLEGLSLALCKAMLTAQSFQEMK